MAESIFLPNDVISSAHLVNKANRRPDIIAVNLSVLDKAFEFGLSSDFDTWRTAIANNEQKAKTHERISWHDVNIISKLKFSGKISSERLSESYNVQEYEDNKGDEAKKYKAGMVRYYPHFCPLTTLCRTFYETQTQY